MRASLQTSSHLTLEHSSFNSGVKQSLNIPMAPNKYSHPWNLSRQPAKENGIKSNLEDSDPDYDIHSPSHRGQISPDLPHHDLASHKSMAQTEKTRRSARARKPMSYLIPAYVPDDDPVETNDVIIPKPTSKNPPPRPTAENEPPVKRLRMHISRDHPLPSPPPLPKIPAQYLQGDCIPPWLMDIPIVKPSPKMNSLSQNSISHQHPHSGPGSHQLSSPSRPTSPSKSTIHPSPQSQPDGVDLSSTTFFEEREQDREKYWARYDYNYSAPHLQPRYYGSQPPSNERWADLDTQNPHAIPESTFTSFVQPLFDVFAPAEPSPADSEASELASRLGKSGKSVPFGYDVGLRVYDSQL